MNALTCLLEALVEGHLGLPAKISGLRGVDVVSLVVEEPVLDKLQVFAFVVLEPHVLQNLARHFQIGVAFLNGNAIQLAWFFF